MIAVDTNILVYAHRGETSRHRKALRFLSKTLEGDRIWGLPVFALAEFIRVTTHPYYFSPPSRLKDALTFLDRTVESPSVQILSPESLFPTLFRDLIGKARATGNLAFDAAIAAVCLEHGVREIVTEDRDFARFPGISVRSLDIA